MGIIRTIKRFFGFGRKGGIDDWIGHEIDILWLEAKEKFPDLVGQIKAGIKDVQNDEISGGEKAVKVAVRVLSVAPSVLSSLPDAKAFFVHAVTSVYSEGLDELREQAGKLIGRL